MRKLSGVLTLVVAMGALAAPSTARAVKEEPRKAVRARLAEHVADLKLTEDQEKKIANIQKEYGPKIAKARKELAAMVKEEVGKLRGALTDTQKEKLETLKEVGRTLRLESLAMRWARLKDLDLTDAEREKIQGIRKKVRPKLAKALTELEGLLTDKQKKARLAAFKAGKSRREILAALGLTDKQKEKVEAVGTKLRTAVREECEMIRDVLTESQKEKLLEIKEERKDRVRNRLAYRIAALKALKLTDDQKAKLAEIRKEYRPKVQQAGNKLRAAAREGLTKILAVLEE
jgi:Spy/CpxP family protein refolding chaperone